MPTSRTEALLTTPPQRQGAAAPHAKSAVAAATAPPIAARRHQPPQATALPARGMTTTSKAMTSAAAQPAGCPQPGWVTARAKRSPTKDCATTSETCSVAPPGTGQEAACGPAVTPTTTVLSRSAETGTFCDNTSAATQRGTEAPNTGRKAAEASTPTDKPPPQQTMGLGIPTHIGRAQRQRTQHRQHGQ